MKPSLGMSHTESGSSEFALRRSPRLLGKFGLRRSPRLLGKSAMTMPKRSQIAPGKSAAKGKSTISTRKSPAKGKSAISTPKSRAKGKSAITMSKRSQISPRKSPPKGKSAMTVPERSQISPRKPSKPRKSPANSNGLAYFSHDYFGTDTLMRSNRECEAQHFKEMYTYSTDCHAKKTCIHPGGVFAWEDKSSSGISWVAVRGRSTTCVVFKRNLEHVKDRLGSYLGYNSPEITFNLFGLTVISEIEVLADLPTGSCQKFVSCGQKQHVNKPFAIVSVDPSNPNGLVNNEDEEAAVKYLEGVIEEDKVFYRHEAIEAAIHAFQLLCNQKFEPDDIWVAVAFIGEEVNLPRFDIEQHLAYVNQTTDECKDHVGGSCSAPSI